MNRHSRNRVTPPSRKYKLSAADDNDVETVYLVTVTPPGYDFEVKDITPEPPDVETAAVLANEAEFLRVKEEQDEYWQDSTHDWEKYPRSW